MPRWLFLTFAAAVVLAVLGSAFIVLRGTPAKPPGSGAALACGSSACPAVPLPA